jgi:hypothetical protein
MRRVSLILVAVAGLALGGFFGDGDPRSDYIQEADEACRPFAKREAELRIEIRRARVAKDTAGALEAARRLSRVGERQLAAMRKIKAPPEDKARIDRLLDTFEEAGASADDAIEAAEQGDRRAQFVAVKTTQRKALKAARLARDYGFEVCLTGRRGPPRVQGSGAAPGRSP